MLIAEVAVHVPSLPAASPTVGYAARLAARWQARLAGVHVLPPLDSMSLADDPQTLAALSREQQRRRHEAIDARTAFYVQGSKLKAVLGSLVWVGLL